MQPKAALLVCRAINRERRSNRRVSLGIVLVRLIVALKQAFQLLSSCDSLSYRAVPVSAGFLFTVVSSCCPCETATERSKLRHRRRLMMIVAVIPMTTVNWKRPPRVEKGAGGKAKDARNRDDPASGKKRPNRPKNTTAGVVPRPVGSGKVATTSRTRRKIQRYRPQPRRL
jgi:hypothetical protein